MKRGWMLLVMVAVFGFSGVANAAPLDIIGTATYSSNVYNLIYEDDNNGQGLVWLDYTPVYANWQSQKDWAAGLNGVGVLDYNLNPGKNVSWEGDWRLPSAGVNPQSGYNQTTSEMGHLYYDSDSLGKTAGGPLGNTYPFDHLQPYYYWSGTEYSPFPVLAWYFHFDYGFQHFENKVSFYYAYSWAVRPGDVVSAPIPEPATMLLLGSGLAGLGLFRRVRRRHG